GTEGPSRSSPPGAAPGLEPPGLCRLSRGLALAARCRPVRCALPPPLAGAAAGLAARARRLRGTAAERRSRSAGAARRPWSADALRHRRAPWRAGLARGGRAARGRRGPAAGSPTRLQAPAGGVAHRLGLARRHPGHRGPAGDDRAVRTRGIAARLDRPRTRLRAPRALDLRPLAAPCARGRARIVMREYIRTNPRPTDR